MSHSIKFLLLLLVLTVPSTILATTNDIVLAQQQVTLDQAVKQVKKNKQSKVLAAETKKIGATPVHVIKVLTSDGHVKKIHIKAVKE